MTEPNETDREFLAVAVELTLQLLNAAERQQSFPGPLHPDPEDSDASNEKGKREAIKRERRRFEDLRARLQVDQTHGMPVAWEFVGIALGAELTQLPSRFDDSDELAARYDADSDDLYEQWVNEAAENYWKPLVTSRGRPDGEVSQ